MSGYQTYQRYQRIEEQARLLGFRLGRPGHHYSSSEYGDMVALYPNDEALPIYNRDAEIWTGTFNDIEQFLTGWAKAQQYDAMLRMTDDKRRKQFEAKELERQRIAREKAEQREMYEVLSGKSKKEVEKLIK